MSKKIMACMLFSFISISLLMGCGRKGALEPHPSAKIEAEDNTDETQPQEDKPFILDRLIQ